MTNGKEIWVTTAYKMAALKGINALRIETLAKKVGISKSSFYHHFADLEILMEHLLKYHITQSYIIAEKEQKAKNINPELIDIIVEHQTDLLFNRQLRFHREYTLFLDTLKQSDKIIGDAFVMLWVRDLNLNLTQKQLESIYELALENFFLQINPTNLNPRWLTDYFANLKRIAHNFS